MVGMMGLPAGTPPVPSPLGAGASSARVIGEKWAPDEGAAASAVPPRPARHSGGLRGAQEGVNAPAFPLRLPGGRGPAEPTEAAALIQLLGVFPAHPELGTGCGEKQGLVSSSFPVPVGGGRAQTLKVPYGQVLTRVNACPLPGSPRPPHGCPGWGLPVGGLSQEPWCRRQSWAETRPFRFLGRHLIGLLISV